MECLTEYYACAVFMEGFPSYLRNGWSVNLRPIENCIFSIRSIERNMRPILRTVWLRGCIQRETWGPYAGADFDLTLSHSRLQSPVA